MVRRRKQHLLLGCFIAIIICFIVAITREPEPYYVTPREPTDAEVWASQIVFESGANLSVIQPLDATWQPVSGAHNKFLVYSAFYEGRREQHRSVRILGAAATKQHPAELAWCVMQFANQTQGFSVHAKIKIIREHHNLFYSACFVFCPLGEDQAPPVSVSVVTRLQGPPSNHLLVIDNINSGVSKEQRGSLAVCVKPIHNYGQELNLIEFLEFYSLLGAEHFTFYHHNVSTEISCLMQSYVDRDVATWLGWEPDLQSQKEVRTQGMFTALNDCLYRNMYRYDNVAMVDLDEFILPRKGGDLIELMSKLDHLHQKSNAGSYVFQNAFFYQTWPSVNSDDPLASRLVTLSKTRRKVKLLPHKQRSKYICKPELTVEVGNHFVWEHLRKVKSINVLSDIALSQHYRSVCEFGGVECLKEPASPDNTALQYSTELLERVKTALKKLETECRLTGV